MGKSLVSASVCSKSWLRGFNNKPRLLLVLILMGITGLPGLNVQGVGAAKREMSLRPEPANNWSGMVPDGMKSIRPVTINSLLLPSVKIIADDGATGDGFGISVAISGSTAAIGARGNEGFKGAVYIFESQQNGNGNWQQVKKLTGSDGAFNDQFGISVAISGDTIAIGAHGDDSDKGSAYIFERDQGGPNNWGQVKKLMADDGESSDLFGTSIALSSNTVIIGAAWDDSRTGSVYVFERNQGGLNNWGQVAKLIADDGEAMDQFGFSVAVDINTAVVGARDDVVNGNFRQGSAYIFERNQGGANNWGQLKKLTADDGEAIDGFGHSVALSEDTIVIGATFDDAKGSAYVFERDQGGAGNWGQSQKLIANDADFNDVFGAAAAINCDKIVIGATGDNGGIGSAYIFERDQGGPNNWGETQKLTANDGESSDFFGGSVALSCDTAIIGAAGDDNIKGSAYIFEDTCPAMAFDICLQDDHNLNNQLLFSSTTGDYLILCNGLTLVGRGIVGNKRGLISLIDFTADRRLQAFLYMNQQRGSVALQVPPTAFPCTINDSNVGNNNCGCSLP